MVSKLINKFLSLFNLRISRVKSGKPIYPVEASIRDKEIIDYILRPSAKTEMSKRKAISMVSIDRLWAVIQATKYIVKNKIPGDFVECGVWRGGCALAMAMVLKDLNEDRKIFLFDTFKGMTEPKSNDIEHYTGLSARNEFLTFQKENYNEWCYASIEDVRFQFSKNKLEKYIKCIKGDVIETLKDNNNLPSIISLLRLDTDWYESTKVELEILYPRLQKNGVLLLDDYGYWEGAKQAFDEYLNENDLEDNNLIWKTDTSGRGLIKK